MGNKFRNRKKLWSDIILKEYCYKPDVCQTCFNGNFFLKEAKDTNIINRYYLRCNQTPCRKNKFLSIYFFASIKIYLQSIILEVFSLFLIARLNATQIHNKLSTHLKNNISYNTVCTILDNIRNCKK